MQEKIKELKNRKGKIEELGGALVHSQKSGVASFYFFNLLIFIKILIMIIYNCLVKIIPSQ